MTADPVRPQETLRERLRDAAMPPLHQLEVQISGLDRDCACGIVAEVVADAVLPIVETARQLSALRDKVKALADAIDTVYGLTVLGTRMAEISRELRALVEESQGGAQAEVESRVEFPHGPVHDCDGLTCWRCDKPPSGCLCADLDDETHITINAYGINHERSMDLLTAVADATYAFKDFDVIVSARGPRAPIEEPQGGEG